MRVLPDQLSELQKQRDKWVQVNLKFVGRSLRAGQGMDSVIGKTDGEKEQAEPTRKALHRRLARLKVQVQQLADTAPPEIYVEVRDLLNEVNTQVSNEAWREAHVGVTNAEKRFAVLAPLCQQWKALRTALGESAVELERLSTLITTEEFSTLRSHWDEADLLVDGGIKALTMAPAQKRVDELNEALRQRRTEAEQRMTRLSLLHLKREEEQATLKRLVKRARAAGLDDMAQRFEQVREPLEKLVDELDEVAIQKALDLAAQEQSNSVGTLEGAEAKIELQRRLARLQEIQIERDTLVQDHEDDLDAALQRMQDDVAEKQSALDVLLKAGDPDQIQDTEDALTALAEEYRLLVEDMVPIQALQKRMKRSLSEFAQITESQQNSKKEAWRKVSLAYQDLPEDLLDSSAEGWAQHDAWEEVEFGRFFGELAGFLAGAEGAQRQAAFDKAGKDYSAVKKAWQDQIRHATPVHQQRATLAMGALDPLLVNDKKRIELSQPEQGTVKTHLDALLLLIDEVKQHRLTRQNTAKQIDGEDKGHSVKRHGPDVSEKQLQHRLTSGMTPDGVFSPTKKSTRFNNYDELIATRQKAFDEATRLYGVVFGAQLDQAPGPGDDTEYIMRVDHKREVGTGFQGTGTPQSVPGKDGEVYLSFVAIKLTHSRTKISWESGRWRAVQHFPS